MMLIMMVGIPGSGKSTWIKRYLEACNNPDDWVIVSSDDYIDQKATELGKTYNECWPLYNKEAEQICKEKVKFAVENNLNIIWDQTNLSKKVRAKRLAMIPESYSKYWCYHVEPDDTELERRLNSRPGKTISKKVIEDMKVRLEVPHIDEGFHGFVR